MTRFKFVVSALAVLMILMLSFTSAGAQAGLPETATYDPDVTADPAPVSPVSYTYTKLPLFQFTQYESVLKYRITVTKEDGTPYYVYTGKADCYIEMCSMQPGIPIAGIYGLVPGKGIYRWTVQAKTAEGTWTPPQDPRVQFAMISTGFNSSFTSNKKNWQDIEGVWNLMTAGYLKNAGILDVYTSTAHQYYIFGDFVYETRFKLKSKHVYSGTELDRQAGGIIVIGHPYEVLGKQIWHQGVYVLIRNDQKARIFEYAHDDYIDELDTGWDPAPMIIPGGWNTIKVIVVGNNMAVYINDEYWMTFSDPVYELLAWNGFVGITHYRYAAEAEQMLVDWAKLEKLNPPKGE